MYSQRTSYSKENPTNKNTWTVWEVFESSASPFPLTAHSSSRDAPGLRSGGARRMSLHTRGAQRGLWHPLGSTARKANSQPSPAQRGNNPHTHGRKERKPHKHRNRVLTTARASAALLFSIFLCFFMLMLVQSVKHSICGKPSVTTTLYMAEIQVFPHQILQQMAPTNCNHLTNKKTKW